MFLFCFECISAKVGKCSCLPPVCASFDHQECSRGWVKHSCCGWEKKGVRERGLCINQTDWISKAEICTYVPIGVTSLTYFSLLYFQMMIVSKKMDHFLGKCKKILLSQMYLWATVAIERGISSSSSCLNREGPLAQSLGHTCQSASPLLGHRDQCISEVTLGGSCVCSCIKRGGHLLCMQKTPVSTSGLIRCSQWLLPHY